MNANELLSKFVNPNDPRPYIQHPIANDGFLWATNGHMAVRIPYDGAECTLELCEDLSILPEMKRYFSIVPWLGGKFQPIQETIEERKCMQCDDKGLMPEIVSGTCSDCDGEGNFYHGVHSYECKECNGTGITYKATIETVKCDNCSGTGVIHSTIVGGLYFNQDYIDTIKAMPGAVMWTPDKPGLCAFRFDGGSGVIMSLSR